MDVSAREAFSRRLIEAMLEIGLRSTRNAKSGVDVGPLAKTARVTREMARRYTEGTAIPDVNRMKMIAEWLGVRLAWLRDGEGEMRSPGLAVREPDPAGYGINGEAREVALAWQKLSPETRGVMRDVIFMLASGERRFPWLRRGRPVGETYAQWEHRQEQNFSAMVELERRRREKT